MAAQPAALPAPAPERSPWYASFAIGGGDGNLRLAAPAGLGARTISFHDFFGKGAATFAFDVEIGATVTPRLLLGGQLTMFGAGATWKRPLGEETRSLGISNLNAVATFFPFQRGLFLKTGLGFSSIGTEHKVPRAEKETHKANGGNVALGAGYALWLGQRFNMSLNLDWSAQSYRGNEFERSSFWRAGLGFAWY